MAEVKYYQGERTGFKSSLTRHLTYPTFFDILK